jgi:hypothetical protein
VIDAVLTPHPNAWTCGTGKWSLKLAQQLGVRCLPLSASHMIRGLGFVSTRMSELSSTDAPPARFDLLVHDWVTHDDFTWPHHWDKWIEGAERLYVANPVLLAQVMPYRPDAQCLPIPAAMDGLPSKPGYRVLTFGMAHKRLAGHFDRLKDQLEREHPNYQIRLSTAVHEGSPWDRSLETADAQLRPIFGDRLRFLGYLADDALADELQAADAVALYYTPALRANNTSYWAAKEAGKVIYTNRDSLSPADDAPAPSWDEVTRALGV